MDVFALRDRVVTNYRDCIESFVRIRGERIAGFVDDVFDRGDLWPEAILQLNPAYEPGPTLDELAEWGCYCQPRRSSSGIPMGGRFASIITSVKPSKLPAGGSPTL
jgi:hypothetical protein